MRQKGYSCVRWEGTNLHICTLLQTLKFSIKNTGFMDSHHLRQSLENILQVIEILNQSLIRDVTICIDGEYYSSLADHLEASHCEEMETLLFSMPTIRSLTFLGDIAAWGFDLHTAEDLILEIEEGITWVPLVTTKTT